MANGIPNHTFKGPATCSPERGDPAVAGLIANYLQSVGGTKISEGINVASAYAQSSVPKVANTQGANLIS